MNQADLSFLDPTLPVPERARRLVAQLTLREKIAQTLHSAPPIPRLKIPAYNWWNECLHGVGRSGKATVFPQSIGLAATFNPGLVQQIAAAISDEARAKYNDAQRRGNCGPYAGLTFWSPNINIFRDPRWGRGQETFGEDPFLTACMGSAFVRGLQGDHPRYLKAVATPKHFAVHSGPESGRHSFNAVVEESDLRDTYLPAFEACMREAGAASIMTAYNRVNGEPCSASPTLLGRILRNEWGFEGYVVSDCGAVEDIHAQHHCAEDMPSAAAMALREGCDLCCGEIYRNLLEAVQRGLISEEQITRSVERLFSARIRLGMFDPPEEVPWSGLSSEIVCCEAHQKLALEAARQSIVLLCNDGTLPLDESKLKRLAVAGPLALDLLSLLGNYHGVSPTLTPLLSGLACSAGPGVSIDFHKGCELTGAEVSSPWMLNHLLGACDAIIACVGYTPELEGEEGDAFNSDAAGDRTRLSLPGNQEELLVRLCDLGKPVIAVVCAGSPVSLGRAQERVAAELFCWYPGQAGGIAVAETIFGRSNPSAKLPITFPASYEDLPPFEDYSMNGRTYRYSRKAPLFWFGHGLSYTTFAISDIQWHEESSEEISVNVNVKNTGQRDGAEVIQVYASPAVPCEQVPIRWLVGFQRIFLQSGHEASIMLKIATQRLRLHSYDGFTALKNAALCLQVGQGSLATLAKRASSL